MAMAGFADVYEPAAIASIVERLKAELRETVFDNSAFLLLVDSAVIESACLVIAAGLLKVPCVLVHTAHRTRVASIASLAGCAYVLEYDSEQRKVVRRSLQPAVPSWSTVCCARDVTGGGRPV